MALKVSSPGAHRGRRVPRRLAGVGGHLSGPVAFRKKKLLLEFALQGA